MLLRTPFLLLVPATLMVFPYFQHANTSAADFASEGIHISIAFKSPQISDENKYSLRGMVVNSVTGEPIRAALVQIYFNGQSSMLTRPDGKFQFDGLPIGQSPITVRKPGFFSEEELEPDPRGQRQATTGPDSSPIVLKLIPEGVIYGRISQEDGESIEGLPVALLEWRLQNGRKVWHQRPGLQTDEDGNFRIAELPPGNYFLSAGPSRNPVAFPAKLSQPGAQGLPLAYYPLGSDLSAAVPISIAPGQKIESDFVIPSRPFYRVSGTVSGYTQGQSVNLQVRNSVGITLPYNLRFDSATGAFRILWIPAGSYTLQAQASDGQGHSLAATIPLTVNAEVPGVHLTLLPTISIAIHMRIVSSGADTELFSDQENYPPANVQLISHPGELSETTYDSHQGGESGTTSLELQNVAPGTYTVEIKPTGPFYVQSATSGMTNLLESDLSVVPGSSPQPIEITLRDDVASLTGAVSLDNQSQRATILVISEHASVPPRIQPTDPGGGFLLPFLPPGIYKILAVDSADRLEYTNPEALKKYLWKAREITLSPEQSAKIDLELVKVGE